jgi:hypothetical protein
MTTYTNAEPLNSPVTGNCAKTVSNLELFGDVTNNGGYADGTPSANQAVALGRFQLGLNGHLANTIGTFAAGPIIQILGTATTYAAHANVANGATSLTALAFVSITAAASLNATATLAQLQTLLSPTAYDAGTSYNVGDVVGSGGITYISLVGSNEGNTPASSPTDWVAAYVVAVFTAGVVPKSRSHQSPAITNGSYSVRELGPQPNLTRGCDGTH